MTSTAFPVAPPYDFFDQGEYVFPGGSKRAPFGTANFREVSKPEADFIPLAISSVVFQGEKFGAEGRWESLFT